MISSDKAEKQRATDNSRPTITEGKYKLMLGTAAVYCKDEAAADSIIDRYSKYERITSIKKIGFVKNRKNSRRKRK